MQDQLDAFVGWKTLGTRTHCPALMAVFKHAAGNKVPKDDLFQRMYLEEATKIHVAYHAGYVTMIVDGILTDGDQFSISDKKKFADAFNCHPERRAMQERKFRIGQPSFFARAASAMVRHR